MNIYLKQAEIIIALKQYITQQGINVEGKVINIVFTSGRKNTGLSAELSIEDADIPGFTEADEEEGGAPTAAPTLTVVPAQPPEKKAEVEAPVAIEAVEEEPEVVVPVQEPEEETNKPKTISLFN